MRDALLPGVATPSSILLDLHYLIFHHHIQQDFAGPGPHAPIVPQPALGPFTHQSSSNASSGSGSAMPLLAPCVPMPKESVHSCIPLIASQYPRGFTLSLDLTHTFGIAADASRCAWVIHQGGFGRLESCTGSGHPSRPWTCLFLCEAHKGGGFNCPYFVGWHPKTQDRAQPICVRDVGCLVITLGV